MIVPLLVLQFQTTPPPAPAPLDVAGRGDRPVHVWLSSASPLARGSAVRVYVQVASDGNLVVLQRRPDGRIGVLFPASPTGAPFVRAGTYEIHGPRDGAALVVAEPDGEGMILAALTTDPLQVDEFARQADWNSDALIPSWSGADAEGALSDIVQRMLGDGTFNYDLVTRSEEHTSELQSRGHLVCRLLLEKKKKTRETTPYRRLRSTLENPS